MPDNTTPTITSFQIDPVPAPAPTQPEPTIVFKNEATPVVENPVEPPKIETSAGTPSEAPLPPPELPPLGSVIPKDEPTSKAGMVIILAVIAALGGSYVYWNDISNYIKGFGTYISKSVEKPVEKKDARAPNLTKEAVPEEPRYIPTPIAKKLPASVLEAREYYLRILNEDQSVTVRTGGSRSWRFGNPCSILWGKFAKDNGSIGAAEKYAVWEAHARGRKACYDLLFTSDHGYKERSVADAMRRYAPIKEGFKTDKYIKAVEKAKINSATKMSDLPESKRQALIDVLMEVEDYQSGRVTEFDNLKDFAKRGH